MSKGKKGKASVDPGANWDESLVEETVNDVRLHKCTQTHITSVTDQQSAFPLYIYCASSCKLVHENA